LPHIEDLFDLRRIYFLLLKRFWIIAVVVVLGMITATAIVTRLPKTYESRAVLQVDLKEKKILNADDVVQENSSTPDYINTIAQDIQSQNVLLRVVKANQLDKNPAFAPPKSGGVHYTDDQLVALLFKKLQINVRRQTRLIDITASDTDPVMARNLTAAMMKEFFRESFEQRMSVNRVASEFLAEEADKLKKKLEQSEQNLQRYKEEHDAVSLEQNQNIIVTKLQELNTAVTTAKNERLKLESDIEHLKKSPAGDTEALLRISSVAALPQVVAARQTLLSAEADFGTLKEHYLPKHPKYIAAVNKIETIKQSLAEATSKAGEVLNQQYDSAVQTENKLAEALKEQETKALELGKIAIPFNVLSREVETDKTMYESVVSRMKETGVEAGVESAPFHVIEEPMVPSNPSKPKRVQILLICFILLTAGTAAAIIAWDVTGSGIRTVDEAESTFGLPVLGAIPNQNLTPGEKLAIRLARERAAFPDRVEKTRELLERKRKGKRVGFHHVRRLLRSAPPLPSEKEIIRYPIALLDSPASPLAESYRTLRTTISLIGPRAETQVLLFTSAIPEEGKTFSSLNCAVSFAQQGERVLLIDTDLRRPSLHHALLNGEEHDGLSEYIRGEKSLDEVILPFDRLPGLHIMPAGKRAPNPAELLASCDFVGLLEKLKTRFDRIIIDSAPVNAVADTLLISGVAKRVIVVIRSEKTPSRAIQRALTHLRKSGTNLTGLVLNRLDRGASAGYYYYYYGDKYLKGSVYGTTTESRIGKS
jgi:succinoglycan biosynthesis transport protein ExoP